MFMHESVCHSYSNPMELQTLDLNLHLSSQDTLFCLITCLFALSYAQHALFGLVWLSLLVCSLHALPISFVSSFACLLAYFFCLCMYMHGAWRLGARVRPPKRKQKGQARGRKPIKGQCLIDQWAQPLQSGFLFLFVSKPLLQSMYQGFPSPCTLYFSCPLLGPRSLGMAMFVLQFLYLSGPYSWNVGNVCFTFLLCVIALCMMYVYIYACTCVGDCALFMMDFVVT